MNLLDKKTSSAGPVTEQQKEVELKLRTDPEGMAILMETPRLLTAARDGKRSDMHAVYFDTPALALYERGANLRVRKEDGRFIQTVKTAGTRAGIMSREERKVEVPGFEPHPEWLETVGAATELHGERCADLGPVFTTKYNRLVNLLTYGDRDGHASLIEIACDRGVIMSDAGERPILEIELELLQGNPAALYGLAIELHQHYPVHVETRGKADRGYGLISGTPPPWRTSEKPVLPSAINVDDAIATVFRTGFSNWLVNEAAAVDGGDPEGVHQMRVALRRLRSALVVFRRFLPKKQGAWLKAECRWLAACLGSARDFDVFLTEILDPVAQANPGDRGLLALRRRTETARAAAYETMRHAIESPRYGRFVLDFGQWLESAAWRQGGDRAAKRLDGPLRTRAVKLLTHQHREVMELSEHMVDGTDEQRHDLRIAVKKLRYSIDFMPADKANRQRREFRQDLSRLQDDLGVMNDIAVTQERLESLIAHDANAASPSHDLISASGQVLGWWAGIAEQRKADLGEARRRFKSREPFWLQTS